MTVGLPDRLLISGVPGSGKSCFVKFLVTEHRFTAITGDEDKDKRLFNWIIGMAARGNALIIKPFGWFRRPLVVESGYQPEYWATVVPTMHAAGFETWWFDADYDDALGAFKARKGNGDGFDPQWTKIVAGRRQIDALYGDHIIKTLRDGRHMPPEEIAVVMRHR